MCRTLVLLSDGENGKASELVCYRGLCFPLPWIKGRFLKFPRPHPLEPRPYIGSSPTLSVRPRPPPPLTWRVQPKTPIMSIATVRYSASTSHQGLSNLKAGCCSENCLNSASGIILPMREEEVWFGDLRQWHLLVGPPKSQTLLRICTLPCRNLAESRSCVSSFPLPQTSPPSWSQATKVLTSSAPWDLCTNLNLPALSGLRRAVPSATVPQLARVSFQNQGILP